MNELLLKLHLLDSLHAAQASNEKTLLLVQALKAGVITLDQVTMKANGWEIRREETDEINLRATVGQDGQSLEVLRD